MPRQACYGVWSIYRSSGVALYCSPQKKWGSSVTLSISLMNCVFRFHPPLSHADQQRFPSREQAVPLSAPARSSRDAFSDLGGR